MYYVTFTSLKQVECPIGFGLDKQTALERFRWASEQSLARAGFLLTQDLMLLEAFHLYVAALSRHIVSCIGDSLCHFYTDFVSMMRMFVQWLLCW